MIEWDDVDRQTNKNVNCLFFLFFFSPLDCIFQRCNSVFFFVKMKVENLINVHTDKHLKGYRIVFPLSFYFISFFFPLLKSHVGVSLNIRSLPPTFLPTFIVFTPLTTLTLRIHLLSSPFARKSNKHTHPHTRRHIGDKEY